MIQISDIKIIKLMVTFEPPGKKYVLMMIVSFKHKYTDTIIRRSPNVRNSKFETDEIIS
jgi:hypothetical protein